ncbi:hypothetical protein J6590_065528, partial [Homalodisca vitripennis]
LTVLSRISSRFVNDTLNEFSEGLFPRRPTRFYKSHPSRAGRATFLAVSAQIASPGISSQQAFLSTNISYSASDRL